MKQELEQIDLEKVDWPYVLPQYIDNAFLTTLEGNRRWGPCPLCDGDDSFRLSLGETGKERSGSYFCCKCREGGGFLKLIVEVTGKSYGDIFKELRTGNHGVVAQAPRRRIEVKPKKERSPEEKIRDLQQAWDESARVTEDSPVWRYLSGRIPGLKLEWISPDVRYHPGMKYRTWDNKDMGLWPVMVLRVKASDSKPRTLQRHFLTPEGKKVPFTNKKGQSRAKLQMPSVNGLAGGSVKLNTAVSRTLVMCEGAETGFAAVAKWENRFEVKALVDAGNLAKADINWDDYDLIMILADRDKFDENLGDRPGEHYAGIIGAKLKGMGKRFLIIPSVVEKTDFCDVWQKQYEKRERLEAARIARSKERDETRQQNMSRQHAA